MTRITFHVVRDTFHEMLFISWYISRNTGKGYSVRLHQADTVGYATVSDWGCAPKLSKGAQVVVSPNARLPGSPARGTSSNASGTFNTFNKGTIHALPLVLTAFWGNWDAIIVILLHGCSAGDGASASCIISINATHSATHSGTPHTASLLPRHSRCETKNAVQLMHGTCHKWNFVTQAPRPHL
jgi:hypothetical protein